MAVDLKRIRRGVEKRPHRVLVYGFDGIGKTSFAGGAPGAFFLDANKGSHKLNVERIDIIDWNDAKQWLDAIASGGVTLKDGKPIQTVVVDSMTDFESMSHMQIFGGSDTVTSFKGGYGKGDDHAMLEWRPFIGMLERVWLSGKNVVLCAHARTKHFEDPSGPPYDRFEVACRPTLAGALRQFVDYVFFCREDVGRMKEGGVITTGTRWMFTRRTPAYDAKARGSLIFPEKILLSWGDFQKAVDADGNRDGIEVVINEMLNEIGDADLDKQVRDFLKQYPGELVQTHNRVSARLEMARKAKSDQAQQAATAPPAAA